jgi:hypothetical protein
MEYAQGGLQKYTPLAIIDRGDDKVAMNCDVIGQGNYRSLPSRRSPGSEENPSPCYSEFTEQRHKIADFFVRFKIERT